METWVVTGTGLAACHSHLMVATLPDTAGSFKVEERIRVRDCPSWMYFVASEQPCIAYAGIVTSLFSNVKSLMKHTLLYRLQ